MTDVIKPGETLPDMSVKAIVKNEIKDIKLSILFADHSLMHPKDKKIVLFLYQELSHQLVQQAFTWFFNLC